MLNIAAAKIDTLDQSSSTMIAVNRQHPRHSYDPTRTTGLRRRFSAEMYKRFNALAGVIRKAIVDRDCFGLKERPQPFAVAAAEDMNLPAPRAFAFSRDREKVEGFMAWLREQEEAGILETTFRRQQGQAIEEAWTDAYVRSAYQRGLSRARRELRGAGYDVSSVESLPGGIRELFHQPVHLDRAGVLYTRTFNELRGITNEMDQQISRILAHGISSGQSPSALARQINSTINLPRVTVRIPGIGPRRLTSIQRARTLARTEVIRAHHVATIQEYRNAGTVGVRLRAEFATAGDYRVCRECLDKEGRVYELDEAEAVIPVHPNCRCIMLPLDKEESEEARRTDQLPPSPEPPPEAGSAYQDYLNAEKSFEELAGEVLDPERVRASSTSTTIVNLNSKIQSVILRGRRIEEVDPSLFRFIRSELSDALGGPSSRRFVKNQAIRNVLTEDFFQAQNLEEFSDEIRAVVNEVERLAGEFADLNSLRRVRWVEYVKGLPLEDYKKARLDLILPRINQETDDLVLTDFVKTLFRKGTDHVPDDLFFDVHKTGNLRYHLLEGRGRANFDSSINSIHLFYDSLNQRTISHEFGHAVDGLGSALGDGMWGFYSPGLKWGNSRYFTRAQAEDYRSWFAKQHSGEKGLYTNGDGYYWKGNWLDNYEGRIYTDTEVGEEWWAMNSQRHNAYYVGIQDMEQIYDRAEDITKDFLQRKGKKRLDELDTGSLSRLVIAVRNDDDIVKLFSGSFGGRMRLNWSREAIEEAYYRSLVRAGKEVPETLKVRVKGFFTDIDTTIQNISPNAEGWDSARTLYPELTNFMNKKVYKEINYSRGERQFLSRLMKGGEEVAEEVAQGNPPMSIIGRFSRCLIAAAPSTTGISNLDKPDPCRDYVRGSDGKWYWGGEEVAEEIAEELNEMRIPPAWSEVVVAVDKAKKVQAIGKDAAGRWQYRYSAEHIAEQARKKFDRVKSFSRDIPAVRRGMDDGIAAGDPRAYALRLEDNTAIRAGSRTDFKAKKKAYGLTTLEKRHVKVDGDKVTLDFVAKEGIPAHYEVRDSVLARWLREERLPELEDGDMIFYDVPANKLNDYIKELAGNKDYTIKDYRTYHGTRIAYEELKQYAGVELTDKQKREIVKAVSKTASEFLRNTPTMARNSYIDPMVWDFIGGLP